MRYLLVQYVGKGEPRMDNVRPHSNRVWEKSGSVLRIPEDEAYSYLAFPMVWKLASAATVDHADLEKANQPASVELLIGIIGMLSKTNIRSVIEASVGFLREAGENVEGLDFDLNDPKACKDHDDRIHQIMLAIRGMSKDAINMDRRTGRPKLSAVRMICSVKDLTQRELDQAVVLSEKAA